MRPPPERVRVHVPRVAERGPEHAVVEVREREARRDAQAAPDRRVEADDLDLDRERRVAVVGRRAEPFRERRGPGLGVARGAGRAAQDRIEGLVDRDVRARGREQRPLRPMSAGGAIMRLLRSQPFARRASLIVTRNGPL